ncbi:MAG: hypothetical protein E7282_05915 [Lachnospiraceae bacterium]|nr:hypothetical protein [Lachnospiraceae bacterium]
MKKLFEQVYGRKLDCFEEIKYSLPLYLQDGKTFYRVSVSGKTFVVVFSETKERFNIKNLKKQLATYQNAIKADVVYGFDKISSFQRKSMIENEIPFVSCNGQMYLPFMGVLFEKCAKGEDIVKEHFAPGSQVLFLLFLYENDSYTKLEAAKRLQVLPMTISRASKQLLEKGLIEEKKQGTEIVMTVSVKNRRELYSKAEKYLINPVQSFLYLPNGRVDRSTPASGEFSLSRRSDLGYPKYVEYALYKDLPFFKGLISVDPDLDYETDIVRIQKWKYDPLLFSCNGQVDPVSLICTFADTRDERIHKCLEQVKEEIWNWQII